MTTSLLSPLWYRVAPLRPRLRSHARLHRHHYRGEVWFVLHDRASGRMHRFTPSARLVLAGMDGTRTLESLWEICNRKLGEEAPTQDEMIQLMGQLHASDLMRCDVSPDVAEIFERAEREDRQRIRRSIANPMSIKLPMVDPDRFLAWAAKRIRPVWNAFGAMLWLFVVMPAALLAAVHWSQLTADVSDRVLATNNLLLLLFVFPVIKILHELGHGVATKIHGGEVHDLGLMLLAFVPVPYVDASAATAFRNKTDRIIVGAAGMLTEVFIAALAMYFWVLAEPGMARSIAFNVMLVAGISTVLFNANPLMRYDGYYMLADYLEIPNLASRSTRYLGHLVQRIAFGVRDTGAQKATSAEKAWFVFYSIASFICRTFVTISIVLFIAGKFFVVGVLLAIWSGVLMFVVPIGKLINHLLHSPVLARARTRAHWVTLVFLGATLGFIALVPMPLRTQAEGVVWLPEEAIVRATANGFHSRFLAAPGAWVKVGDPLVESTDPVLAAQVSVGEGKVAELKATYDAQFVEDKKEAELTRRQIEREEVALARLRERAANLIVSSQAEGRLIVPRAVDLPDRFLRKGDLIGYVANQARTVVRVVVSQGEIDLVRNSTTEVQLRSVFRIEQALVGRIVREVPAGVDQLPSRALGVDGGGQLAVDPRDSRGTKSMHRTFHFDIDLPTEQFALFGGRVHVRFEHLAEPLARQWYRSVRQVFLTRFDV